MISEIYVIIMKRNESADHANQANHCSDKKKNQINHSNQTNLSSDKRNNNQ